MGLFDPRTAGLTKTGGRPIDPADVIALLQEVYADGIGTREEAEELIAFDLSLADPTPGWTDFFAASIADQVAGWIDPPDGSNWAKLNNRSGYSSKWSARCCADRCMTTNVLLSGSSRLGPILGTFTYNAEASACEFVATFESRNDHGVFILTRR